MKESVMAWHRHLNKVVSGEIPMCECDNGCGEKFLYGDEVYKIRNLTFVCEDCIGEYLEEGEDADEYLHKLDDDDIEEPDWGEMGW